MNPHVHCAVKWRVVYAVLWLLALAAYSAPWAVADGRAFVGWNFTMPFSITYVIGLALGLVTLLARYRPVAMTIIAGILMILGVLGGFMGLAAMEFVTGLGKIVGTKTPEIKGEWGLGLAFLASILYMVLGAYAGKRI